MRYVAGIALSFCAVAFGQSSPNHFQLPDKLTDPRAKPYSAPRLLVGPLNSPQPLPAASTFQVAPNAKVCAIPLLNALPAKGNVDFKIQVLPTPTEPVDRMPVVKSTPACGTQP